MFLLILVHLLVSASLRIADALIRIEERTSVRNIRQNRGLHPLLRQVPVELLPAEDLLLWIPEQHAELITTDTVAVAIAAVGLLQTLRDFTETAVTREMPVGIIDMLEIVEVEYDQHPVLFMQVQRPVQVVLLAEQSCQTIELVPHLVAVEVVQDRQHGHTEPGHVNPRQPDLHERSQREKQRQRIDELPAAGLEKARHLEEMVHQEDDTGVIHQHVDREAAQPRVVVHRIHRKHQSAREERDGHDQEVYDFQRGRHLQALAGLSALIDRVDHDKRHRGSQAEAQVV